jgi:hypothetical protein
LFDLHRGFSIHLGFLAATPGHDGEAAMLFCFSSVV